MKTELKGDLILIRDLEDTIRATRKYTKGIFRPKQQQSPVQGDGFPSRVLTEYYEVYPEVELSWDMPASEAWAWVWGDIICIDVTFWYDYRSNAAKITIHGGDNALQELQAGIPDFKEIWKKLKATQNAVNNRERNHTEDTVADRHRTGSRAVPNSQ